MKSASGTYKGLSLFVRGISGRKIDEKKKRGKEKREHLCTDSLPAM